MRYPEKYFFGRRYAGFSLIELMIALLLGTIVVGSASAIFVSNHRAYAATETLGRIQESGRIAFELIARDIRDAAQVVCGNDLQIANVLNNAAGSGDWRYDFGKGIKGYENSAPDGIENRYGNSDVLELHSGSGGVNVMAHEVAAANISVESTAGFSVGQVVMICDQQQASIFQIAKIKDNKINHSAGGSIRPGNCTKALGFNLAGVVDCSATGAPNSDWRRPDNMVKWKAYNSQATLVRFVGQRWYIGRNNQGKGSLYRDSLMPSATNGISVVSEEIADGVEDLQFEYLLDGSGSYVTAVSVSDWGRVKAVKVNLKIAHKDQAGAVGGNEVNRNIEFIVALRNRIVDLG